eukprot:scaffold108_cov167-Ochromonas_danica.AAC.5
MLSVEVLPGSIEDRLLLKLGCQGLSWEVERGLDDFAKLHQDLLGLGNSLSLPKSCLLDFKEKVLPKELELYLQDVCLHLEERIWNIDSIMDFFDPSDKLRSPLVHLRMSFLCQQVEALQSKTKDLMSNQRELNVQLEEIREVLRPVSTLLKLPGLASKSATSALAALEVDSSDVNDYCGANSGAATRMSFISVMTNESVVTVEDGDEVIVYQSNDDPGVVQSSSSDDNKDVPSLCAGETAPSKDEEDVEGPALSYPLPNSQYLPKEFYPTNDSIEGFDQGIDLVLKAVGPTEKQLLHRESAVAWIRKQVRVALSVSTLEIGLHATHCLLPDDIIRLDVIVPKSLLLTWHLMLCERLHLLVEKSNSYGGTLFIPPDEEESSLDPFFKENVTFLNHSISGVNHSKQNLHHTVHFVVDNIPVEIVANNRHDLCFMAMLEEIDDKVGKHELFKKSYLLLRAWWAYETTSYLGASIRHYLNDQHLFVLLIAIFNRYHDQIVSPLQALSYFLSEYSHYDGNSQTRASNQPSNIPGQKNHFISSALLEKYWRLYNINISMDGEVGNAPSGGAVGGGNPSVRRPSSSSTEDAVVGHPVEPVAANGSGSDKIAALNCGGSQSALPSLIIPPNTIQNEEMIITRELLKQLSENNLHHFERSSFNVLHPLNHTNMIQEKLSVRRVNRILKAFQMGATNLTFFLRRVKEMNGDKIEAITSYFTNVLAGSRHRGDVAVTTDISTSDNNGDGGNSIEDRLVFENGIAKIHQNINYYDLILEAVVSEHALQSLTMEILATKGSLPVGEIGKVLADITSIPNLSQKLKEKFGGLKKFVELFPMSFVISNDHPFNPNVLLRSSLSTEYLEMIDKGIFPPQLLIRPKKTAASKKKKSQSASFTSLSHNGEVIFRSDYPASAVGSSATPPFNNLSNGGGSATGSPVSTIHNSNSCGNLNNFNVNGGANGNNGHRMSIPSPSFHNSSHPNLKGNGIVTGSSMTSNTTSSMMSANVVTTASSGGVMKNGSVNMSNRAKLTGQSKVIGNNNSGYGQAAFYVNESNYSYGNGGQLRGNGQPNTQMNVPGNYGGYYSPSDSMNATGRSDNSLQHGFNSMGSNGFLSGTSVETAYPLYAPHSANSSNSNSYSGSNNTVYVNSLLQAMIPPSPAAMGVNDAANVGGYGNSYLSQLRRDSFEVPMTNNSHGYSNPLGANTSNSNTALYNLGLSTSTPSPVNTNANVRSSFDYGDSTLINTAGLLGSANASTTMNTSNDSASNLVVSAPVTTTSNTNGRGSTGGESYVSRLFMR